MNIPPNRPLPLLVQNSTPQDQQWLNQNESLLVEIAKLERIETLAGDAIAPAAAVALCGEMKLLVPMSGLIDKTQELERLAREISKLNSEIEKATRKLDNPSFVDRAPAEVVLQERERITRFQSDLTKLTEQQQTIEAL